MSNEETKRKLLQKDSFRLAKGLVLKRKRTTFAPLLPQFGIRNSL